MTVVSKLYDAFVQLALQRSNAPAMQQLNSLASTGKKEDGWSEVADAPRLEQCFCQRTQIWNQGEFFLLKIPLVGTHTVTSHNLFHTDPTPAWAGVGSVFAPRGAKNKT